MNAPRKIWTLAGLMAATTAIAFVVQISGTPVYDAGVRIPWWAFAIAIFVAEAYVVHVPFRRDAESFSLSEIPLVLGLFFADPSQLLLAQVVGSLAALRLVRKQSPLKLAFNTSLTTLDTAVAIVLFRAFVDPSGGIAREAVPAAGAAWLSSLVGVVMVMAVIAITQGSLSRGTFRRVLGMGTLAVTANTALGLIAVVTLRSEPWMIVALIVPAALLLCAYRGYASERQHHTKLETLYGSTRALQRSLDLEATVRTVLEQAREMLRAEIASVTLFASGEEPAMRITWGPGDAIMRENDLELDPTEGVWARAVSEGTGVLLPRPIRNERLRVYFEALGMRDAIVAPLFGASGVVGTITVGNRLGEIGTFGVEDLRLLEMMANHASVSLENSRLVERLRVGLEHQTELNRMKDEFVATVSHELRTPLTSIQGFVKTLLRPDAHYRPDELRSFLSVMDRQSDRLRSLIEDLLFVSRIESRSVVPQVSTICLGDVIDDVVSAQLPRAGARRIERRVDEALPPFESDEECVHRILSNLVVNALKYSEDGDPVTITARLEGETVRVSVEDRGYGIPEDKQGAIFERFFQVDQSHTRRVGGTGLGLYISRSLAETIGGTLVLERSSPGGGSVFTLELPLRGARPEAPRAALIELSAS